MLDAGLGRVVGQRSLFGDSCQHRTYKQNAAAIALLMHLSGAGLGRVEYAPQGHIQGALHGFNGQLQERLPPGVVGIAYEDIEMPETFNGLLYHAIDSRALGDIRPTDQCFPAQVSHLPCDFFGIFQMAVVVDDNICPLTRHLEGAAAPDTARGAGNKSNFTI